MHFFPICLVPSFQLLARWGCNKQGREGNKTHCRMLRNRDQKGHACNKSISRLFSRKNIVKYASRVTPKAEKGLSEKWKRRGWSHYYYFFFTSRVPVPLNKSPSSHVTISIWEGGILHAHSTSCICYIPKFVRLQSTITKRNCSLPKSHRISQSLKAHRL